jgi:hypothetical protein
MQVTLTPQAEELLRQALARSPGRSPEEILEEALAHEAMCAPADPVRERLKTIPGIKLPRRWPPRFKPVEPLRLEGELPSERLVRERR